ncbi:MAG: hypothetical protein GTN59_07650 [Candidatus Dadabacteria bacterium]|jgi:hypothetical protein|nr:hypothetical protein [Candidatus Dadabacteria bacterium]
MLIKSNSLISETAKNLNLPEELVIDVVNYYYSELRNKMENLEYNRIYVPKIGTFYISEKKIKESIETLIHIIETKKPETFKEIGILNDKNNMLFLQQEVYNRLIKDKENYESKKNMGS